VAFQVFEPVFVRGCNDFQALDRVENDLEVVSDLVEALFVFALHPGENLYRLGQGFQAFVHVHIRRVSLSLFSCKAA